MKVEKTPQSLKPLFEELAVLDKREGRIASIVLNATKNNDNTMRNKLKLSFNS